MTTEHLLFFSCNEEFNIFCIMHEHYDIAIIPLRDGPNHTPNKWSHNQWGDELCVNVIYEKALGDAVPQTYGKWQGQGIKHESGQDEKTTGLFHVSLVLLG